VMQHLIASSDPDAPTVLSQFPDGSRAATNEIHPHKCLHLKSPRELTPAACLAA
jgi:hypothetical protein